MFIPSYLRIFLSLLWMGLILQASQPRDCLCVPRSLIYVNWFYILWPCWTLLWVPVVSFLRLSVPLYRGSCYLETRIIWFPSFQFAFLMLVWVWGTWKHVSFQPHAYPQGTCCSVLACVGTQDQPKLWFYEMSYFPPLQWLPLSVSLQSSNHHWNTATTVLLSCFCCFPVSLSPSNFSAINLSTLRSHPTHHLSLLINPYLNWCIFIHPSWISLRIFF